MDFNKPGIMNTPKEDELDKNTDSTDEEELDEFDKSLIKDLVIKEHFFKKHQSENKGYRCVQSCKICDRKPKNSLNVIDDESYTYLNHINADDDLSFTVEKRQNIIKELIHIFFETKWKNKNVSKSRISSPHSIQEHKPKPTRTSIIKSKSLHETQSKPNNSKEYLRYYRKEIKIHERVCDITPSDQRNKRLSVTHKNTKTDEFYLTNRASHHVVTETKESNETTNLGPLVPRAPMNDKEGPFFIDNEIVDKDVYQKGLAVSKWNPTQVLYEICSLCQWGMPEFGLTDHGLGQGFHYSVTVKDHTFFADGRGQTKKTAKHLASTKLLQYIGFTFDNQTIKSDIMTSHPCDQCQASKKRKVSYNRISHFSPNYVPPHVQYPSHVVCGMMNVEHTIRDTTYFV